MENKMSAIRFEIEDKYGIITVNNPNLNLYSDEVMEGYARIVDEVIDAPIRALC